MNITGDQGHWNTGTTTQKYYLKSYSFFFFFLSDPYINPEAGNVLLPCLKMKKSRHE